MLLVTNDAEDKQQALGLSNYKRHLHSRVVIFIKRSSYFTFFFKVVPAALEIAMEEDVDYRRGLPLDYLSYMGVQNSDKVIMHSRFIRLHIRVFLPTND